MRTVYTDVQGRHRALGSRSDHAGATWRVRVAQAPARRPYAALVLPSCRASPRCSGPTAKSSCTTWPRCPHSIVAIENGARHRPPVGRRPHRPDAAHPAQRRRRPTTCASTSPRARARSSSRSPSRCATPTATPFGLLGVNLDISEIVQAQRTLAALTAVGRLGGEAVARDARRSSPATSARSSPA